MSKEGSVVRTLKTRTHKKIFKIFQINRRLATWLWKQTVEPRERRNNKKRIIVSNSQSST